MLDAGNLGFCSFFGVVVGVGVGVVMEMMMVIRLIGGTLFLSCRLLHGLCSWSYIEASSFGESKTQTLK